LLFWFNTRICVSHTHILMFLSFSSRKNSMSSRNPASQQSPKTTKQLQVAIPLASRKHSVSSPRMVLSPSPAKQQTRSKCLVSGCGKLRMSRWYCDIHTSIHSPSSSFSGSLPLYSRNKHLKGALKLDLRKLRSGAEASSGLGAAVKTDVLGKQMDPNASFEVYDEKMRFFLFV